MNLQIEKQALIDEVLNQPIAKEFESFRGFTGDMPSSKPGDYENLEDYYPMI